MSDFDPGDYVHWEYRTVPPEEQTGDWMNGLGGMGWELVLLDAYRAVFKRQVPPRIWMKQRG